MPDHWPTPRTDRLAARPRIFDSGLTKVLSKQVTVVGWYDDEWGYASRPVDLVSLAGATV